jgi:hypothetical protein
VLANQDSGVIPMRNAKMAKVIVSSVAAIIRVIVSKPIMTSAVTTLN